MSQKIHLLQGCSTVAPVPRPLGSVVVPSMDLPFTKSRCLEPTRGWFPRFFFTGNRRKTQRSSNQEMRHHGNIMGISWKKIMELLWDTNLKYFLVWHLELDFLSSWPWPQRESPNPELAIFIFQQAMAMRTTRKVIVGMCYPIYPLVI